MKNVKKIANLIACISLLAPAAVFGATTRTFTGMDAVNPANIGLKTNWSGNTLPSVSAGDIAQWDGTASGNLSLIYSTGLAGSAGNPGVNIVLASGQTGNVTIDSSSGTGLRINNFTNASSAAAFTLGSSSGNLSVTLGGSAGTTQTWINDSSATATINGDVEFNVGGGGGHGFVLGGSGNWAFNTYLANQSSGSGRFNIAKNNTGTLTLNNTGGALGVGSAGTTTINAGILQVQCPSPFVGGSVPAYSIDGFQYGSVIVNTNGVLDLNGQTITVDALNGSLGTIQSSAGAAALTVGANGGGGTFSGVITNGAGTVALVAAGTNTLTLSGTNTYTGGTTVSGTATLLVNGTIAGNVTVQSGASFGGTGTIPGTVDWSTSGSMLTLVPNQPLNLTGHATLNNNVVVVNVPGVTPLGAGTYTLMTYIPANVTGTLNATPIFTGAGATPGATCTISASSGTVVLTITSPATVGVWTNSIGGNWSTTANWSGGVPHNAADTAVLGVGSSATTVTLDASETVGTISFTNANSFTVANAGNTLTLDNSGNGANIFVTGGSNNVIGAPVFLNDNATVTITPSVGNVLSITNVISGTSGNTLTLASGGTMGLYGNNTYGPSAGSVGTVLGGGALLVGNAQALGAGDLSVLANSTVQFGAPMTFANNVQIPESTTLNIDNGNNAISLSGSITGGGSITGTGTNTTTINNVGLLNTVRVNVGKLVLASNGSTTVTNLQSSGTNAFLEIAPGTITVENISTGGGNNFADDGATCKIDSGATLNCVGGGYVAVGNTVNSTNIATLDIYGSLSVPASFVIARHGIGVMNLYSGGVCVIAAPSKAIYLSQNEGTATLNLNGGTLVTPSIGDGPPNANTTNRFYFNGGMLQATNTTSSGFINHIWASVRFYVRNGGGTIDNNGVNIISLMPLLHSDISGDNATDGGITFKGSAVTTLSGVTNAYTGPTVVAAGTLALTNASFNPASSLSISNGAVLELDSAATNPIAALYLGGVSQPAGIYSSNNAPSYINGTGALQVVAAGPIAPTNSPTITQFSLANVGPSGGDVVINGTNGNTGATYYLLMGTNVATPLAQWRTVATNIASGTAFTFIGTNAVTAGESQQFYILSSTNYNP